MRVLCLVLLSWVEGRGGLLRRRTTWRRKYREAVFRFGPVRVGIVLGIGRESVYLRREREGVVVEDFVSKAVGSHLISGNYPDDTGRAAPPRYGDGRSLTIFSE